jgi:hypothetical protein
MNRVTTMLQTKNILRRIKIILSCLVVGALAGCGARFGEVKGTVTSQGKVVSSGTVLIRGSDMLPYYGNIEDDGSYTVPKVPVGKATIAVVSPDPEMAKNVPLFPPGPRIGFEKKMAGPVIRGDPKKWFPLPEKYREFETSGLTMTVRGGMNHWDIPVD